MMSPWGQRQDSISDQVESVCQALGESEYPMLVAWMKFYVMGITITQEDYRKIHDLAMNLGCRDAADMFQRRWIRIQAARSRDASCGEDREQE